MSCWLARTPMQMALTLILIVAIPFFIAMLIIYISFGFIWKHSFSCGIFCCYLMEKMEIKEIKAAQPSHYIQFEHYKAPAYWERRSAEFPDAMEAWLEEESANPSVAALLETLYQDDPKETTFKCAAAVVSNNWALTTSGCVGGVSTIRIGSNYWSKEGNVRKVKNIVYPDNSKSPTLVLVNFQKIDYVQAAKIAKTFDKAVTTFSWSGNKLNLPLDRRRKFQRLRKWDIELYQKDECARFGKPEHVSCYIASKGSHCGIKINAPLMDSKNNLVGMHLGTLCEKNTSYSVVFYLDIHNYNAWLSETIYN